MRCTLVGRRAHLAVWCAAIVPLALGVLATSTRAADELLSEVAAVDGWQAMTPRRELAPQFSSARNGEQLALSIKSDAREGLDGYWTRRFQVTGGQWHRFSTWRQVAEVESPRRSAMVRVIWRDANDKLVPIGPESNTTFQPHTHPTAFAEHPTDGATKDGWTEVAGTYLAPPKATQAIVELHLRWAPSGSITWREANLAPSSAPAGRKVRLASIHYMPRDGQSPADNCRQFVPLVEQAAQQRADLVVLGETITIVNNGYKDRIADAAEPVPGPTTDYFGQLAKRHNLYIVVGLYERADHLIYNVAVLLGPDGGIVGKYRKVMLPREEVEKGIAPGHEYPVFDTRFGKLGMMVCYDAFFPEVARHLSNRGAEVIALPVWGCNPTLAAARAIENHIYLVSSTYMQPTDNWMRSGIWDHCGRLLAEGNQGGSVVLAEVDLDERTYWPSLGDFRSRLPRERAED
ncbi:MAG: carbon-nitrogen hydrolase family protein [Planctomycetes bacterium]|nr:carbon-nitrogen hydrolase family protein [Planctomycetota bacterium]